MVYETVTSETRGYLTLDSERVSPALDFLTTALNRAGASKRTGHLDPIKHEFEHDVKLDVEARVRRGAKAVLEEVLREEMSRHLPAGYRELTPTRRGEPGM